MDKYSWSFDRDAERWYNGADTIKECIAAAKEEADGYPGEKPTVVYVGENEPFEISVDAELVLEDLEQQAYDFVGELGGDWRAYDPKELDQLDELAADLTKITKAWLKKHGYAPTFYRIEKIKEYSLFEEVKNNG